MHMHMSPCPCHVHAHVQARLHVTKSTSVDFVTCNLYKGELRPQSTELFIRITATGGAGGMIGYLGTTCCSQFDSNTLSEAQASEVSIVRFSCRARIFEILKSRKMANV